MYLASNDEIDIWYKPSSTDDSIIIKQIVNNYCQIDPLT